MSYTKGSIVWFYKTPGDPDITYQGDDPIAATVDSVLSPTRADLIVMMSNTNPIRRTNVALIASGDPLVRPCARVERA